MILRAFVSVFSFLILVTSCDLSQHETEEKKLDPVKIAISKNAVLDSIISKGKLRAVTDYGSVSYLIYRGEPIGYQYELLKDFTEYLNVELELVVESNMNKSIEMLNDGSVDILAMGLTVTNDRSNQFSFSLPIFTTRQVLVQRKPMGFEKMLTADEIESHLLRNHLNLAGCRINVQAGTIFENRLNTISDEIADTIVIINDNRDIEELITAVANSEIDYTVADEHVAKVNTRYYRNIDVKTALSFPQKIAWAAKKNQTGIVDTLNTWLKKFNTTLRSRLLYNKYFKNIRSGKMVKSRFNSYTGGQLSPFDNELKEAAQLIGWDWRLLASLVYQESEFKPHVRSWVGAFGLMQLMPGVMDKYNLDSTASTSQQLNSGVKHLKYIFKQLPNEITDTTEQIKFLLASYNCGLGHILDARRLAVKYDKDPNVWAKNVDSCILNLSEKEYYYDPVVYNGYVRGNETFNFVEEIIERYNIYKELIDH
jgi:peptidoglycan lytic transglycosylase F